MNYLSRILGATTVAKVLLLCMAQAAELTPGGVSIDFEKSKYNEAVGLSEGRVDANKKDLPQWLSVRVTPMAFLDNVFCVPEKNPASITFSVKNVREENPEITYLFVKLPKPFSLSGNTDRVKLIDKKEDAEAIIYRFEVLLKKPNNQYNIERSGFSIMLKTDLPANKKLYPMEYWLEYANSKTLPYTTSLKVIPAFSASRPVIFKTGSVTHSEVGFDRKSSELFASFYKNCGFNIVSNSGYAKDFMLAMKKEGIERYWGNWWFSNGYFLGCEKKPENVKFRFADGKACASKWQEALCPVEAYSNGKYFQEHVIGYAEKMLFKQDLGEHVMINWEPELFDFKGCFCDRCKEEFINYTKLPREEIEKKWPQDILGSYKEQWIKFRSWQHGELVSAIQKGFDELGKKYGRKIYFVPEIHWASIFNECSDRFEQYHPSEYLNKLPWIEPWGPYIFYKYSASDYKLGLHMNTYIAARMMKAKISELLKNSAQLPKTLAFTLGSWSDSGTEPEAIGFETIAFFLNGWEGSFVYNFPYGYDYRYWREIAKANGLIARYENFIFKGQSCQTVNIKVETPVPGPASRDATSPLASEVIYEEVKATPLVIVRGFQLEKERLAVIGNFWQKGEAFVKLQIRGLQNNIKYAVWPPWKDGKPEIFEITKNNMKYAIWQPEQKRCFGNDKGDAALTAEELAKGILLHVGALRWEFFIIEAYQSNKDYGEVITPAWMEKEMKKRLPVIQASYNKEIQNINK